MKHNGGTGYNPVNGLIVHLKTWDPSSVDALQCEYTVVERGRCGCVKKDLVGGF